MIVLGAEAAVIRHFQARMPYVPSHHQRRVCEKAATQSFNKRWWHRANESWIRASPHARPRNLADAARFRRCRFRFLQLAFWLLLSFAREALVHL
jgi:hypothetical protein